MDRGDSGAGGSGAEGVREIVNTPRAGLIAALILAIVALGLIVQVGYVTYYL